MTILDPQHTSKILRCITDGVITTDMNGNVSYMNNVAEQLTGLNINDVMGQSFTDLISLKRDDDGRPVVAGETNELTSGHVAVLSTGGKEYSITYSMTVLKNDNNHSMGFVIVLHDVTREFDLTQKLKWQAMHDSLTGVKNRRAFELQVNTLLAGRGKHIDNSLIYMDLDRFKLVNDTCGHQAGDELLKIVCHKLESQLRAGDTLCRIGGDEFAIILEGCPMERAVEIAQRQVNTIADIKFSWEGKIFTIGASIGLIPIDEELDTLESIVSLADKNCYAAKSRGGNCVHVYTSDDSIVARRGDEISYVSDLQYALEYESFALTWQAIKPANSYTDYDGMHEFLVRLDLMDGQRIQPNNFIQVAERYGLMSHLDKWVTKNAFSIIADLPNNADPRQLYNINLSGQTLGDISTLKFIDEQFTKTGINPQQICFEITETAVVNSFNTARELIEQLRQWGCKLALDDFGTGLSSFAYLKHFKVDFIKIDGEFIRQVRNDKIDQVMVKTVQAASNELGIATIAEWVENQETMDTLVEMGIDYFQGNYIAELETLSIPQAATEKNSY